MIKKKEINLNFRKAKEEDIKILFEWVNDPLVIKNKILTKEKINWEDHKQWFQQKFLNENSIIYIFEINKQKIGQIRLDFEKELIKIDYSVSKDFRGRGLSKIMIDMILKKYSNQNKIFIANVKKDNLASFKILKSLNFEYNIQKNIYVFKRKI